MTQVVDVMISIAIVFVIAMFVLHIVRRSILHYFEKIELKTPIYGAPSTFDNGAPSTFVMYPPRNSNTLIDLIAKEDWKAMKKQNKNFGNPS